MSEDEILEKIDEKTTARRSLFREPKKAAKLDREIAALYDRLRAARSGVDSDGRKTIVKRARIERELEKLML